MGDVITQEKAEAFLREDLHYAVASVLQIFPAMPLNRIDALADFVFNIGIAGFKSSTLFRIIKADPDNLTRIEWEFNRWVHCKGKVLSGLVARRRWEVSCYRGQIPENP